jgi:hypothetical protein
MEPFKYNCGAQFGNLCYTQFVLNLIILFVNLDIDCVIRSEIQTFLRILYVKHCRKFRFNYIMTSRSHLLTISNSTVQIGDLEQHFFKNIFEKYIIIFSYSITV